MLVGVPSEIKDNESRVGLIPAAVDELVHHGHRVLVEAGAGLGSGLPDEEYVAAGAEIVERAERIFAEAEMIVKVKEPLASASASASGAGRSCSPTCILRPISEQTRDLMALGRHLHRL